MLVSRGGWDRVGTWVPVPYVDSKAAELLFRHKVIAFLREEELLSEERIELLLSWQNTGFSVHNGVSVGSEDAADTETADADEDAETADAEGEEQSEA